MKSQGTYAGIRPCVSSFGAVQFDERSKNHKKHLDGFFTLVYLSVTFGAVAVFTMVVCIHMHHGWGAAFCVLAITMGISNAVFFIVTPLYRHRLPGGSPLTLVAQVLVTASRKQNVPFSNIELVGLNEVSGNHSAVKGNSRVPHTDDFSSFFWSFGRQILDKAAPKTKEDGKDPNPCRLCTVTQVEELNVLIKILPVPSCTIMLGAVLTEFPTLSVQQAYSMNTHLGSLNLPAACMPVVPGLSIFALISLYYKAIVPICRRITCHPRGLSHFQRVGIGLVLSIVSVLCARILERYRRNYAIKHGFELNFLKSMPRLSAYWLLIQYCLIGFAKASCIVGLLEFLYQEAADAIRSIASAYAAVVGGVGCFVATIINKQTTLLKLFLQSRDLLNGLIEI